jgi:hypothetical protein
VVDNRLHLASPTALSVCLWLHDASQELLLEAPLTAGREVTASFKAEPEYAYVVVPYTG